MVSIIAAALAGHQWYDATTDSEDPATGCTGCDDWFGDENAVDDGTFAAHQARAVLAAISEAGTVEWGVRHDGESTLFELKSSKSSAYQAVETAGTVGVHCHVEQRITFPWERAE